MYVLSLVSTNCTRPGLQCARAHQRTAQFQLLRIPQHSGVAAGQERQDSAFQSPKSLKTCLIPLEINYFGLIVSLVFIFIINCRQRVGVFKEEEILNRLFFLSFGSAQDIWRRAPSVKVSLELPFKMTDIVSAMVRFFIIYTDKPWSKSLFTQNKRTLSLSIMNRVILYLGTFTYNIGRLNLSLYYTSHTWVMDCCYYSDV